MRRALTLLIPATVATAAVAFFVFATAPAPALRLTGAVPETVVAGAYHVHSARSDGTGTREGIARAAASAGLRFVVITDHGDGTQPPSPPAYIDGVLCIDAVEINTANGHLVALDLGGPAPYPLAGDAPDVIEDIHRLGGAAIVAHPDSPSASLRWRGAARYDGLEWFNADDAWRDSPPTALLAAALRSLVRGPESIASLYDRPAFTLQRWDAALRQRPIAGVAALDAHARIGGDAEDWRGPSIAWPSYATLFGTMAQVVVLDARLAGDAADDARAVIDALVAGKTFSTVTAYTAPASLEFFVEQGSARAGMGQHLDPWDAAAPARVGAAVPQAPGARLTLVAGGQILSEGRGRLELTRPLAPGAYRIEVFLPGRNDSASLPWIVLNPIYVGMRRDEPGSDDVAAVDDADAIDIPADAAAWTVERDARSRGDITTEPPVVRLDFALAGGDPAGQYAALVARAPADAGLDRIAFTARASRPMRVSVQIRVPGGESGQRWRRSIYLDETPRDIVVRLADMAPAGETRTLRPIVARLHSLLFVVDTLNTAPGTTGTIWLRDVRLGVGRTGDQVRTVSMR